MIRRDTPAVAELLARSPLPVRSRVVTQTKGTSWCSRLGVGFTTPFRKTNQMLRILKEINQADLLDRTRQGKRNNETNIGTWNVF